jgi:SNF2 family DNA or RNA helicase
VHLCYILSPDFYINQKKNKRDNNDNHDDNESDTDTFINKQNIVSIIQQNNVLKRTKKMVGLEIVDLNCNELLVEWKSEHEKQFAQEIHSLLKISRVSEKHLTSFAKQIGQGFGLMKSSMLISVLRAKQSCIMPELMKKKVVWLVETNKINKKYLNVFNNDNNFISTSSKLEKVINIILERKDNKRGKIIFCQFKDEMNYLFDRMIENGLSSMIIDGRCNGKKRMIQLEKAVDVLILQIQTGCEGLNLQEFYSEVYFVSPHWNPSVEDQAIARCHRMGQKQLVEVFKFEMNGFGLINDNESDNDNDSENKNKNKNKTISLEKHIRNIQDFKRSLRLT